MRTRVYMRAHAHMHAHREFLQLKEKIIKEKYKRKVYKRKYIKENYIKENNKVDHDRLTGAHTAAPKRRAGACARTRQINIIYYIIYYLL